MGEVVKTSGGIRQHSPTQSEWMWPDLCWKDLSYHLIAGMSTGDVIYDEQHRRAHPAGTRAATRDMNLWWH